MIRILRIMEYTYPDTVIAEEDLNLWHVPANGTYRPGRGKCIKSATIMDLNFEGDRELNAIVMEGLAFGGAYHKQFFLNKIAEKLGISHNFHRGTAP